jgi:UDP-MurNAc hydroxylase
MRATSLGHAGLLIETDSVSIVCDPWFIPTFLGSWFVFPRNDQLSAELLARVGHADYLYISHLHADHFDEQFLTEHVDKGIAVLVPGYPTKELERRIRALGFDNIIRTVDAEAVDLGGGVTAAIHVETSIADGPGGDSALVVSDGVTRLVDQNDCRTSDLQALRSHGPVDLHWLQYSGAIWYPMVYDEPPDVMRRLCDAKVETQYSRAMRYVESIDARYVVPSAGPPVFLDPELFHLNVISGDELSIFPDQRGFLSRLQRQWRGNGILNIPGTVIDITPDAISVTHPLPQNEVDAIFTDKRAYLERYADDWSGWLTTYKQSWAQPTDDLFERLQAWWEPLLAAAPHLCQSVGASALIRSGDESIIVDFLAAEVRRFDGEAYGFSFDIPRPLLETVAAEQAVDLSNSLFLSCRFRAWRGGPYNEYLYNFFKSLSPVRIRRAEAEAIRKRFPEEEDESDEVQVGEHIVQRYCPHRHADLSIFGEVDGAELVCTLHGWRFDLASGRCLTASDHQLRVRPASTNCAQITS